MPVMDTTTIIIIVAIIVAALALILLLRKGGTQRIETRRPDESEGPYVAAKDRPYVDADRTEAKVQRPIIAEAEDRPMPAAAPVAPAPEPAPQPAPAPVSAPPAPPPPSRRADGAQGNSLADQQATAATDVAGQFMGVEARAELPGATGAPHDLEMLKGVGPKFASRLGELGITRYDQLAALSENEIEILDDKLGPFRGRLTRDRIVEQASYLARGDTDGFEAKFGKLG